MKYSPCQTCAKCIIDAMSTEPDPETGLPWRAVTRCPIEPMPEWNEQGECPGAERYN